MTWCDIHMGNSQQERNITNVTIWNLGQNAWLPSFSLFRKQRLCSEAWLLVHPYRLWSWLRTARSKSAVRLHCVYDDAPQTCVFQGKLQSPVTLPTGPNVIRFRIFFTWGIISKPESALGTGLTHYRDTTATGVKSSKVQIACSATNITMRWYQLLIL